MNYGCDPLIAENRKEEKFDVIDTEGKQGRVFFSLSIYNIVVLKPLIYSNRETTQITADKIREIWFFCNNMSTARLPICSNIVYTSKSIFVYKLGKSCVMNT